MKATDETAKNSQDRESTLADREPYYIDDHALRVRLAREVAEREMRKFGDISEYEVRKVVGQRADLNYDREDVPGPLEGEESLSFDKSDEEA